MSGPLLALAATLVLLVAGCTAPPGPPAGTASTTSAGSNHCPDDAVRRATFAAADEFMRGPILENAFTLRIEGTMQGKVGTRILALDPDAKSLRVTDLDSDVRVLGVEYSIDTAESRGHGRNHEPGATYERLFAILEAIVEEPEPDFFDDLGVDDYEVECVQSLGVEAIQYTYEKDGRRDVNVAERTGAHRPLSGEVVDPAMQDNYRASVAYGSPTISVVSTLSKLPLGVSMDVISYGTNDRGGISLIGEVAAGSDWAPFSQIETRLVDTGDGTVYDARTLQAGSWDMGDGDMFQYQDRDANGMLSTGDRFSMDLAAGLDVAFFDLWASAAVNLEARA